jgi:CBS domain containing-hemolysin-like protein
VTALILSVVCLFLNAFFVAAEFALVKVHVTQLDRAVRRGDRRAKAAKAVLSRLDRYLSVTQFGITVASLGLGWIGEPAIAHLGDSVAIAVTGAPLGSGGHVVVAVLGLGLLTFLHLLLGELVPKFIAIQHAEATTLTAAIPLQVVSTVFRPVLWFLEGAQRAVLRLIDIDPDMANEGNLSEDEIIGLLAAAATKGNAKAREEQRICEKVLRFGRRPVRQMMVPRVDVVSLPVDATGDRAYELFRSHELSRILLVRESLDDVVGYLYVKDFLLVDTARHRASLEGLARRVLFVPEGRDGLSTLRDLQAAGMQLAVVVDEYGGTSGIVTLEDLIEEIVGDIRDELDEEPPQVVRVSPDNSVWEADARATVDLLRDVGVPIDERWFGEPIGKVVMDQLGQLPHIGDIVNLAEGVVAEVLATSRRRIERVRVRVEKPAT